MRRAAPVALALAAAGCGADRPDRPDHPAPGEQVLARARARSPATADFARRVDARVGVTPDRRSYYVMWPADADGRRAVVTLHGYFSTAFDELRRWQPEVARRGLAVVALQWRLGRGSRRSYSPAAIRAQARRLLGAAGAGRALLHGYSSAAPRAYGVAALDRGRRFSLYVGNAGGAKPGYPMHGAVFGGGLGSRPLAGTRWVLYCGARDPDPELTGCPIMRRTRRAIERRGGTVERLLVDPAAGHDGLFEHPRNLRAVLDFFQGRGRAGAAAAIANGGGQRGT
jgi:hypothetical protein